MSKPVKTMIADELRSRYADLDSALWVEMLGIDGITTNLFRRELHGRRMHLEIVKNSMFRRAVAGSTMSRLAERLEGPAALLSGGDSLIDVAKLLDDWLPRLKTLRLRGALLEGEYLDEKTVAGLARMPTKRDMQGRVAALVRSPGANLASAINSGGARIAGCIKALIEKLEAAPAA